MRDCIDLDADETWQQLVTNAFLPTHIPNIRILPSGMDDFYFEHETATLLKDSSSYDVTCHYHKLLEKVIEPVKDQFDII